ncbi:MAG: TetR/AcrR family transcriptional regulator [bacterium]
MDEKEKILELGEEKFFREGFYKTTMDDVASEMRMSKKTIYKFFPSKEDLIMGIAKFFMNKMKTKILAALNSDKNAIEKLEQLIQILAGASQRISPKMMDEMRRHFPSLWDEVEKFRTEMMLANVTKVIEQGKKEGLFKDYPTVIIMYTLVGSVRTVVNPEFILNNNFSIISAALTVFRILIEGITTEKGKNIFNKTINENAPWKN